MFHLRRFLFGLIVVSNLILIPQNLIGKGTFHKRVLRVVPLEVEFELTNKRLTDISSMKAYSEMIFNEILLGKLIAYSVENDSVNIPLPIAYIEDMLKRKVVDSYLETECPNCEGTMIYMKEQLDFSHITHCNVLEDWTFDPTTGKTNIIIVGIEILKNNFDEGRKLKNRTGLFWVRYADLLYATRKYRQYHPYDNLATFIWNDYFLSDIKPTEHK